MYERIEQIKKELEDKEKISLLMLIDLQSHLDKLVNEWGSNGEQYLIM